MARMVLAAALVLYAAVAVAHAARVLEHHQPADDGFFGEGPAPQLALEAESPSGQGPPPAVPGGVRVRDDGGGAIADILWFVFRWANEAAGDRRKDY